MEGSSREGSGYGFNGRSYVSISGFRQRLPAGAYNIRRDFNGTMHFSPTQQMSDELTFGDDDVAQRIMREYNQFVSLREEYARYGFVHKRALLLHGAPGNGKTSVVIQLSRILASRHDGVTIFLECHTDPDLVAEAIAEIRRLDQTRPIIVVMEEVDSLYERFPTEMLTLLDGGAEVSSTFFVATTNFLEKLDARVRNRPSRFDTVIEIGPPREYARVRFLRAKGIDVGVAEAIARASEGLSFSHLKEFIVAHVILGQDIDAVAERLRSMGDGDEGDGDPDGDGSE